MTGIRLIPFDPLHLDIFDWRETENQMYNTGSDLTRRLTAAMAAGPEVFEAWTMVHDGRILVIGGVFKVSEKTAYCWTVFSRWSAGIPVSGVKAVRARFGDIVARMGLHRLTTFNLAGAEAHHRWCTWLGFRAEGMERKFDDEGRDYVRFALVL